MVQTTCCWLNGRHCGVAQHVLVSRPRGLGTLVGKWYRTLLVLVDTRSYSSITDTVETH
jgi:hypothetical protein